MECLPPAFACSHYSLNAQLMWWLVISGFALGMTERGVLGPGAPRRTSDMKMSTWESWAPAFSTNHMAGHHELVPFRLVFATNRKVLSVELRYRSSRVRRGTGDSIQGIRHFAARRVGTHESCTWLP